MWARFKHILSALWLHFALLESRRHILPAVGSNEEEPTIDASSNSPRQSSKPSPSSAMPLSKAVVKRRAITKPVGRSSNKTPKE